MKLPSSIPEWLLLLTIMLLPWYVVRWQISGLPVTLLEVFIVLTVGVWIISLIRNRQSHPVSLKQLDGWGWLWLSLIILSATIGLIASPSIRQGLGIYKAYFIEPVLLGLVVANLGRRSNNWWLILAALAVASLEIAALCLTQVVFGWPNWAPAELAQGRASAMFNTGNAVGLFIGPVVALLIPVGIWLWQAHRRRWAGCFAGLVLLDIVAIVLSKSRGGLVALAILLSIGLAVWLWFELGRFWFKKASWKWWPGIIIGGYAVIVVGFLFFGNHPPHVANPYTRPGFSTFTVRQCTWQGTTAMLLAKPIVGAGLAGFAADYLPYATCDAEPLTYPHNLILNFWSELGILGLAAILGMLSWWLSRAGWLIRQNRLGWWLGWGFGLVVVYWLVHGLVDVPYFKNDLAAEWWILFGLLVSAPVLLNNKDLDTE